MSLCGPAVASGLTARPSGQKKSAPLMMESPREEKQVDSLPTKELILRSLSTSATNDADADKRKYITSPAINGRCTKDEEDKCYTFLLELLREDA